MAIVLARIGNRRLEKREAGAERIWDGSQQENHLSAQRILLKARGEGSKMAYEITYNRLKTENGGES